MGGPNNCIEEMQRAGAEFSWAGMVHTESVNLVTHITGLGCTSARTVAIKIQTHINDTIVEIHQAARDMKRPNAPTPASYTLDEQEDQLDALDLLKLRYLRLVLSEFLRQARIVPVTKE